MLQKFKQYQNQILIAFKRFPVVVGFAIYSAISFITFYLIQESDILENGYLGKFLMWLTMYPVPAMFLSYALTLREEVLQTKSPKVHVVAQAIWLFIFYVILQFYPHHLVECSGLFSSLSLVLIVSPFIVPFWRIPSDLSLWRFLGKNIKALVIGVLTTAILNAAIAFLLFATNTIFDVEIPEKVWVISAIICWAAVFPILFLSSVPDITNDSTVHRKKFATNVIHFLFIPILLLYVAFLYAYGLKIIFLHADYEMVSVFVSIAMVSTLIITTIIYSAHFDSDQKADRVLLKVLPLLALPLMIAQTLDILFEIYSTYTSKEMVFMMYLTIWFFIAIAISMFCTKKKLRYLIMSFCAAFFLSSVGPQSAYSISQKVMVKEFVSFLNQNGYENLPLDCSDFINLRKALNKGDGIDYNKFEDLRSNIASTFGEEEIAKYIPARSYDCFDDEPVEIDSTFIDLFASNLIINPQPIPKDRNRAIYWDESINENSFDVKNDSLFVELNLTTSDSLPAYHYAIPLDTLKIRNRKDAYENIPVILEDSLSTFVVEYFNLQHGEDGKSLTLRGIVYIK